MKKVTTLLLMAFFAVTAAISQESTFNVGDKVLNVGIGFGAIGYTGTYFSTKIPPISVTGEYGFKDGIIDGKGSIGIGGYAGLASYKWEYTGYGLNYGWKSTNFIIGARGTFHYPLVDKLDTYTGLMLGVRVVSLTEFGTYGSISNSAAGTGAILTWYAGARYYFNDKFAAMAEIGYGISYLNLGIAIKL